MKPRRVPTPSHIAVIGDDPFLCAELSSVLARSGHYLPILDGPRVQRPDIDHEVLRRAKAIALVRPKRLLFAGLPETTSALFGRYFEGGAKVSSVSDLPDPVAKAVLKWGRSKPGLGLLTALRGKRRLVFDEGAPALTSPVAIESEHVVVCEEGHDHSQVIAANYAFSLNAGLLLIPEFPEEEVVDLLEQLYLGKRLADIQRRLREHIGQLPITPGKTVTFITSKIPWGFAFYEFASTHLFRYPDLGVALINGIADEQEGTGGIRTVVGIAAKAVDSEELNSALARLASEGAVARVLRSPNATVLAVTKTIEVFPYDLLLIASHCGDTSGYRWTYQFVDSEGLSREIVVDIAISPEFVPGKDEVRVTQFTRHVSLDDVNWDDEEAKSRMHIGNAIVDFWKLLQEAKLEPIKREPVKRVHGSMALGMDDGNFILTHAPFNSGHRPICINNACSSWHRLASNFMIKGGRAYVGTLRALLDIEANDFTSGMFGANYGEELAGAVWKTQNAMYPDPERRPYVLTGCHFQTLRTRKAGSRKALEEELADALSRWRAKQRQGGQQETTVSQIVDYLDFELKSVRVVLKDKGSGRPQP